MRIMCRCIGRKPASDAAGWRSRRPPWAAEWASAAWGWSSGRSAAGCTPEVRGAARRRNAGGDAYKARFEQAIVEVGCTLRTRVNRRDCLEDDRPAIAGRTGRPGRGAETQLRMRRMRAAPIAESPTHGWRPSGRGLPQCSATAEALDYSLNRWSSLLRYSEDPRVPIANDDDEQQIRPRHHGRVSV
jgi:hypothetical protein